MLALSLLAALISIMLAACAQQAPAAHADSARPGAADANGEWYLLFPPQQTYSSDLPPSMGGPLALAPLSGRNMHGAYAISSLNQLNTKAPLNHWKKIGSFSSERECNDAKAEQIKEAGDPARMAQFAHAHRGRIIDPVMLRDMFQSERCVADSEIP